MPSVVIAAHNEEAVLADTLRALRSASVHELEIVVVPNGCTDETPRIATQYGTHVVTIADPGKSNALNVGDSVASRFPRIYLDADIIIPPGGIDNIVAVLESGTLAAVPARTVALEGRPLLVRAYFAISERLPVFRDGLFGRGLIALSTAGRARFTEFPMMVADDLFLDSLFDQSERALVPDVRVVIQAPFTTSALLRRLVRVRRGNAAIRSASRTGILESTIRPANRWSWLRDVVWADLRLAPAGAVYATLSLLAALMAKRGSRGSLSWGRDDSTREARPADGREHKNKRVP